MSQDDSGKSDLPLSGLFLCISAVMAAIGLLLVAFSSIEDTKQPSARVFVPATLSQTTLPK